MTGLRIFTVYGPAVRPTNWTSSNLGPFIHRIDPVICDIGGVYLWWYGLSFTLGFSGIHFWFRRMRNRLGLSLLEVYDVSLALSVGVLLGGRLVEVFFYEWEYYGAHLGHIPAVWLGGMSTHGLLLGGTLGTLFFCWRRQKGFLSIVDELVIPGAWVMATGRIGNFIDGQIAGSPTDAWWAVQFPDLEGFRHPVVLYDGLKNLLLIPFLLLIRSRKPPRGVVFAHFLFWYAFLRLIVDVFREYRVESWGLGVGQIINLVMAAAGLGLLFWFYRRGAKPGARVATCGAAPGSPAPRLWPRRALLLLILFLCSIIPSDWTQDIPSRYGERHPGLDYSILYPKVENRPVEGRGTPDPAGPTATP